MDNIGSEVVDVCSQSLYGIAKVGSAEGCLMDVILEDLIAAKEGFQFMCVRIFIHTYTGGDEVLRLECAISHHREDINDIMSQAVCMVVTILTIVFHLELTSCHLSDAIVDCLTGVDGCLEIGIFK